MSRGSYYPPNRAGRRYGTASYDEDGLRIGGEHDGYGRPMAQAKDGLSTGMNNRGGSDASESITPNLDRFQASQPKTTAPNYTPAERGLATGALFARYGGTGALIGEHHTQAPDSVRTSLAPTGGTERGMITPGVVSDGQGRSYNPATGIVGRTQTPTLTDQLTAKHGAGWQQKLVQQFPKIGQAGTPENAAFLAEFRRNPNQDAFQVADRVHQPSAIPSPTPAGVTASAQTRHDASDADKYPPTPAGSPEQPPAPPTPAAPAYGTRYGTYGGGNLPVARRSIPDVGAVNPDNASLPTPKVQTPAWKNPFGGPDVSGAPDFPAPGLPGGRYGGTGGVTSPLMAPKPRYALPQNNGDAPTPMFGSQPAVAAVGGSTVGTQSGQTTQLLPPEEAALPKFGARKKAQPLMDRVGQGYN